ncbi:MAG: polymorphic toxin type 34 domain-containing protein [Hormoscilla sp.]
MTSEGNVADTGILNEVRELISEGSATTICEALEIMMAEARVARDTAKIQKIKATQKAKGCRRRRKQ